MKQRARKPEDKQARSRAILAAALAIFEHTPYNNISMAELAKSVGVSKGTLYTYFDSKEELFLALLEDELAGWFADLSNRLKGTPGALSAQTVAYIITASLIDRTGLIKLMTIAHTLLEHNIGYVTARQFRFALLQHVRATGQLLDRRVSFLQWGQGEEFLLRAYAIMIGAYQLAEPPPFIRQIIQNEPDLNTFVMRFESLLQQMLLAQLQYY